MRHLARRTKRDRSARSAGEPAGHEGRRQRRELVGWIALGLLVAVVLTFVARSPAAPSLRKPIAGHISDSRRHPKTTSPRKDAKHHGHSAIDISRSTTTTTTQVALTTTHRKAPAGSRKLVASTLTTTSTEPIPSTTAPASGAAQNSSVAGTLAYPDDLAITLPFNSASGVAGMQVTWIGKAQLTATLRCPGDTTSQAGSTSISLSVSGTPGRCDVTLALDGAEAPTVRYTLRIFTPGS
jgi:hypothetical protein